MNSVLLGIFLICALTNLALTRSLSGTDQPFTWMCGVDICKEGVHYCDDTFKRCDRCNEDVCNRQSPPRQCLPTCHHAAVPSTPAIYTGKCQSGADSWQIPVIVTLAGVVLILLIIVIVLFCRQRRQTVPAVTVEHPTTTQENDTSERVINTAM